MVVIVVGVLVFVLLNKILCWLGVLVVLIIVGIGIYYIGVEWKWWDGLVFCIGNVDSLMGMDGVSLLVIDEGLCLIMCD